MALRTAFAAPFLVVAALVLAGPAGADTACVYPTDYPGDNAPQDKIAAWMAGGAQAAGVPVELPVMGSLAETGLHNTQYSDSDTAGYFQMRKSIWESKYPNFENDPTLQLKWFTDQAVKIRQAKVNGGDSTYGGDPSRYGEWDADILNPPQQYRGKYQPYLDQARSLIASGCATESTPPPDGSQPATTPAADGGPGGGDQTAADTTAPQLTLGGPKTQDVVGTGVISVVVSATEDSTAKVTGTITVGKAARVYHVSAPARHLTKGGSANFRLRLSRRLRQTLALALRHHVVPKVKLTITVTDAAGNHTTSVRRIRLRSVRK